MAAAFATELGKHAAYRGAEALALYGAMGIANRAGRYIDKKVGAPIERKRVKREYQDGGEYYPDYEYDSDEDDGPYAGRPRRRRRGRARVKRAPRAPRAMRAPRAPPGGPRMRPHSHDLAIRDPSALNHSVLGYR